LSRNYRNNHNLPIFKLLVDPGAAIPTYSSFLSGEVMAASASVTAIAMFAVSYARGRAVRRRQRTGRGTSAASGRIPIPETAPASERLLSGTYRGRSVEIDMAQNGLLYITVRVVNERGIFDEFGAGGPIPTVPWLNESCRRTLAALSARWTVAIRGRSLFFSFSGHGSSDPERMPRLLDLACDLADAVDGRAITRV
jgi:hypothetical protein